MSSSSGGLSVTGRLNFKISVSWAGFAEVQAETARSQRQTIYLSYITGDLLFSSQQVSFQRIQMKDFLDDDGSGLYTRLCRSVYLSVCRSSKIFEKLKKKFLRLKC